jgi:hypothetical protein
MDLRSRRAYVRPINKSAGSARIASSDELRAIIEVDRRRLDAYADVLLSLGFDPLELFEVVD